MTKDIDKILDDVFVPEMEYEPKYDVTRTKNKNKKTTRTGATLTEVPEVVLPKTKAEMYAEAKGRLTQETAATSKASGGKRAPKRAKLKTVELEIAAVTRDGDASGGEQLKLRIEQMKSPVSSPVWVGTADEIVPFAWRMPLNPDIARPSKLYKQAVREGRELLLPTHRSN